MNLVYSLTLSFLLFVFITNLSRVFSIDDVEEVLDVTGKPVIAGKEYYIAASISGIATGSGLELARTSNSYCEVTILQSYKPYMFGTSVKLTNLENNSEKLLISTPLKIEVTKKPDCVDSSEWIVYVDYDIKKSCVGIGSYENYYHSQILTGTFGILKHGIGYKFGFSLDESSTYSNIGSYQHIGEGGKRLYLTGEDVKDPFEFVFVPAFFETGIIKSVA